MKKNISILLIIVIVLQGFNTLFIFAQSTPDFNVKGRPINKFYWDNQGLMVYGTPGDVKSEYGNDFDKETNQWRYLGFTYEDSLFTNEEFPNVPGTEANWESKNWQEAPWENPTIRSAFNITDSPWDGRAQYNDLLKKVISWDVNGTDEPINYVHFQSFPSASSTGSYVMYHKSSNGRLYYKTFLAPKLEESEVLNTPFSVETKILSSDFTIDEDESTVDVKVNVKGILDDETYFNSEELKPQYYTRDNIKEWYVKLEYKDRSEYVKLDSDGSNQAENTFNVKLSRSDVVDGEKINFTGTARVVFHNEKYYKDSDTKDCTINVNTSPVTIELPPDISIFAPNKANIGEDYTVEVAPTIPEGATVSSVTLKASTDGVTWTNLSLTDYKVIESYSMVGIVWYRATIILTNGKSQLATAITNIVDQREASVTAKLDLPSSTYEGHWVTGDNRSRYEFEGNSYSAQQAKDMGIGDSDFEFYDSSQYDLDYDLFETRNYDPEENVDMRFQEAGNYKVGLVENPQNSESVEDIKAIQVMQTPSIDLKRLGSEKANRKQTITATVNIHPDHPLVNIKTYIEIEDVDTGDKVRVTPYSHPDSTHIKTNSMTIQDNTYQVILNLDYLIKTDIDRNYKITAYVEDDRGKNDTKTLNSTTKKDLPPIADILAPATIYRGSDGIAKLKITKNGYSHDGDLLKLNNLRYKIDTDNDGSFNDETFVVLSNSLIEKEVSLNRDRVGKILLDYEVQENLTPSTIPEFVTDTDYLKSHTTQTINVDNFAPHTSLRLINNQKIDLLIIGRNSDLGTIQTESEQLKNNLNNNEVVVDIDNFSESANIDNLLLDIEKVSTPYIVPADSYTNIRNVEEDYYTYSDNDNNLIVRKFNDIYYEKKLGSVIDNWEIRDAEIVNDNLYVIRKSTSTGKTRFYHYDLPNNNDYSYETYTMSIDFNTSLNKEFNYIYVGYKYMYDPITRNLIDLNTINDGVLNNNFHNFTDRVENKLYYIERTSSSYNLKFLDLSNGQISIDKQYNITNKYGNVSASQYGGNIVLDKKVFFYDIVREPSYGYYYLITDFDKSTQQFRHIGKYQIISPTATTTKTWTFGFNYIMFAKLIYNDATDTYYLGVQEEYLNSDAPRKFYLKEKMLIFKATNQFSEKVYREINVNSRGNYPDSNQKFVDKFVLNNGYFYTKYVNDYWGVWVSSYKQYDLYKYDLNLNQIATYKVSPILSKEEYDLVNQSDTSKYQVWYERYKDGSNQILRKYYFEGVGLKYKNLISDNADSALVEKVKDDNGKEWIIFITEDFSGYTGIWTGLWILDPETDEYWYTGMFDSIFINNIVKFVKDNKYWIMGDIRYGYFDFEKKEYKSLSDATGYSLGIINAYASNIYNRFIHFHERPDKIGKITFYDSFKNTVLSKINDFNTRSNSDKYITIITDKAVNLTSSEIDEIANAINAKAAKAIWIGNSNNYATGNSIANKTGGQYYNHASYSGAFDILEGYLNTQIPSKQELYTTRVKVGEEISYDKFYLDLEGDGYITSTINWHYRKVGGRTWTQSTPMTVFSSAGTYYASWDTLDNPSPAITNSKFASYRRNANRQEMQIIVGNVEPPQEVINPAIDINVGGNLIVNRKVDFNIGINAGTKTLNYSTLNTSFNYGTDVKPSSTSGTSFSKIFKTSRNYTVTVSIKDTENNLYTQSKTFYIAPDTGITLDTTITPELNHRDAEGKAIFDITVNAQSPDDYIKSIKHYLTYDSNNNNSFDDETPIELTEFENMREFKLEVDSGVGKYKLETIAIEGYDEPTLDAYIIDSDYYSASVEKIVEVDNYSPMLDFTTDKDIYLVGEKIKYISNFDDAELQADFKNAYYDIENDNIAEFKTTYSQNKAIMPSQDATFMYHNLERNELVNTIDKAGEYTISSYVIDDPKAGDSSFDSYKKQSNISQNTIIVHHRPVARLDFSSSHGTATDFDFGNRIYLEGTDLVINDDSYDPDGFNVDTTIEYKLNSGSYTTINSGNSITLQHGNIYTVRVTTEDNWGATDTEVYTVKVINNLDMVPDITPNPVPASEIVTLKLTTNQFATSARTVVFGNSIDLDLTSESVTTKVWEKQYTITSTRPDNVYTAEFYGTSEGKGEIKINKTFEVKTPINLTINMPEYLYVDDTVSIKASTTKYANQTRVILFKGTTYQVSLNMSSTANGNLKDWTRSYTIPDTIPEGNYVAEFRASTPNGNVEVKTANFNVETLQVSATLVPDPALAGDELIFTVDTKGYVDRIEIDVDPDIIAKDDRTGKYNYPTLRFNVNGSINEKRDVLRYILCVWTDQTLNKDNVRLRPEYTFKVRGYKGTNFKEVELKLDVRRSVLDLLHPGVRMN